MYPHRPHVEGLISSASRFRDGAYRKLLDYESSDLDLRHIQQEILNLVALWQVETLVGGSKQLENAPWSSISCPWPLHLACLLLPGHLRWAALLPYHAFCARISASSQTAKHQNHISMVQNLWDMRKRSLSSWKLFSKVFRHNHRRWIAQESSGHRHHSGHTEKCRQKLQGNWDQKNTVNQASACFFSEDSLLPLSFEDRNVSLGLTSWRLVFVV